MLIPSKESKYKEILSTDHIQLGLKSKAIKSASFTFTAQLTNYIITVVAGMILARLLTPQDFGLVAMVLTFSLVIQNFGINGFTEAVVQSKSISHGQMSKLFWTNLLIMIALAIVFALMSPLIAWFYKEPQLINIARAISISIVIGGLTTCHNAILSRNMKFNLTSTGQVTASILSNSIAIIAALQGIGYWALVIRQVALSILTSFFAWLFCHWRPGIPSRGTNIRPILSFGLRTYSNFIVDYVRKTSDRVIIGRFLGKTPLGHYDRAGNLLGLLPGQLSSALTGVGIATLSRLRDEPKRYLEYYSKALSIQALIAFPASGIFVLLGKDIILFLLGSQWGTAGDIVTGFAPAIGLVVIYETVYWLHISLGRPDRLLKWSIGVLFATLAFLFIGIRFGPVGIALAYSVLYYLMLLPALCYAGKPLSIKAGFFLSILWRYWIAAFLAGGVAWFFSSALDPSRLLFVGLAPIFRIFSVSLLYALLYLGFILIFFRGPRPIVFFISTLNEIVRR